MSKDGSGVCIRECVYGKPLSTLSPVFTDSQSDDSFTGVSVCVYVCVVVYECMECKEERRNSETQLIHTHIYTPEVSFFGQK